MAEKKISKFREMILDGCIAAFYTTKGYFLKVRPCFAIDKVAFSFTKKGTAGKDTDSVYMDIADFDQFCDDILSGSMAKKVAEDKANYPSAFEYKTGKNGSKVLNFGSGSITPYVFQGRNTATTFNAFVGVADWQDIKNMAKLWKRVSKTYYEEITYLLVEAVQNIDSHHSDQIEEKTVDSDSEVETVEPVTPEEIPAPAEAVSEKPKTDLRDQRVAVITGNACEYTLLPNGKLEQAENFTESKPSFTLKCNCKELDREVEVVFLSAPIAKQADNFNVLKEYLEKGFRGPFRIEGQLSEYKGREQLRFTTFIKKGA